MVVCSVLLVMVKGGILGPLVSETSHFKVIEVVECVIVRS